MYLHTPGLGTVYEGVVNGFLKVDLLNPIDTFWCVAIRTAFVGSTPVTTYSDTLRLIIATVNCGAVITSFTTSSSSGCVGDTMQVSWRANAVRYYLDGTYVADSGTSSFVIAPGLNTVHLSADGSTDTATGSVSFMGYHCDSARLTGVIDSESGHCIGTDSVTFTAVDTNAVWRTIATPTGIDTLTSASITLPILAPSWTYTLTIGGLYNSMSQTVSVTGIHCDTVFIAAARDTVIDTCTGTGFVRFTDSVIHATSVMLTTPTGTFSVPSDTTLSLVDSFFTYVYTAVGPYDTATWSLPVHGDACMLPVIDTFYSIVSGTCIGTDSVTLVVLASHATTVTVTGPSGTVTLTSDSTLVREPVTGYTNLYSLSVRNPYGYVAEVITVLGHHCDTVSIASLTSSADSVCIGDSTTLVFHVANDTALSIATSAGTIVLAAGDTTARVAVSGSVNTFTVIGTGPYNANTRTITVAGKHCYDTAIIGLFVDSTGGTCIGTDSAKLKFSTVNAATLTLTTPTGSITLPPSSTSVMVPITTAFGVYTLTASTAYNVVMDTLSITAHYCDSPYIGGLECAYTGSWCIGYDSVRLLIDVENTTSVTVTSSDGYTLTYSASDTAVLFPVTGPSATYTVVAYGPHGTYTRTDGVFGASVCPPASIDLYSATVINSCTDSGVVALYIQVSNDTSVTLTTPTCALVLTGDTTLYLSFTSLVNVYTLNVHGLHTDTIASITVLGTDCDTMHFVTITYPDTLCLGIPFASSWTTNASAAVSVDTSAVDFSVPGTYGIWFVATGTHNDDSVHETIVIEKCGISDTTDTSTLVQSVRPRTEAVAYPSPFTTTLTVSSDRPIGILTVMNLVGKELYRSTVDETEVRISAGDWPAGIYFVRLASGETIKVIKE